MGLNVWWLFQPLAYNGVELAKAVNKTQHIGINARLAPICCYHFVLQAWALEKY